MLVYFVCKKISRLAGFSGNRSYARKIIHYLGPLFLAVLYLMSVFVPFLVFKQDIFGDEWLKADVPEGELLWVDTSH